jgi:hypothetical protein
VRCSLATFYRKRRHVKMACGMGPGAAAFLVVMFLGALPATATSVVAPSQQSHRGIYALSLHDAASASGITDVGGEMYYEWSKTCTGWRVNQRVTMELAQSEGSAQTLTLLFSAFEASDGSLFDFTMLQAADGVTTERMSGRATVDDAGAGIVRFDEPAGVRLVLPPLTLFPSRYAVLMLEQAQAGQTNFSALLFDGSSAETAYSVATFFGSQEEALSLHSGRPEPLWPLHMGYFPHNKVTSEPDFEIGVRMFENGIAQAFLIDYGSFAVNSTLIDYEAIPEADCAD